LHDDASGRAEESPRLDPALDVRVSIPSPFGWPTTKQKQQQQRADQWKEPWGEMSREEEAQQDDGVSTIDLRPIASGAVVSSTNCWLLLFNSCIAGPLSPLVLLLLLLLLLLTGALLIIRPDHR
jgi:hypothetical protein